MALTLEEKPDWMGYGVDISLSCGKYAQRLLEVREVSKRSIVSVADVRSLPYKDDVFQLIVGMEVFEHIPNPEAGLLEAVRVLKSGGYAITAFPVQLPLLMHLYVFKDIQEVLELYHRVGLKVLDFEAKEFNLRQGKFIDTFALSIKE